MDHLDYRPIPEPITEATLVRYADWLGQSHMITSEALGLSIQPHIGLSMRQKGWKLGRVDLPRNSKVL